MGFQIEAETRAVAFGAAEPPLLHSGTLGFSLCSLGSSEQEFVVILSSNHGSWY